MFWPGPVLRPVVHGGGEGRGGMSGGEGVGLGRLEERVEDLIRQPNKENLPRYSKAKTMLL